MLSIRTFWIAYLPHLNMTQEIQSIPRCLTETKITRGPYCCSRTDGSDKGNTLWRLVLLRRMSSTNPLKKEPSKRGRCEEGTANSAEKSPVAVIHRLTSSKIKKHIRNRLPYLWHSSDGIVNDSLCTLNVGFFRFHLHVRC